jgi:hypothetical protein
MSWSHVQGTGVQAASGNITSLSVSFAGNVTAGNLIVSGSTTYLNGAATLTLSDNQSNSYSYATTHAGGSAGFFAAIGHSVAAGTNTPSVTWSTGAVGAYPSMSIDEYAGGGSATVDSAISFSGATSTSTPSLGSLTVTGTDLVYAVCGSDGTPATYTAGAGMTARYNQPWVSGKAEGICAEDQLNATTAVNPGWTLNSTISTYPVGVAYKAAAGNTYSLSAGAGSYTLAGQSASLPFGRKLATAAGSYALSGQAAGLAIARKLAASAGSYGLSGQASGLYLGRRLAASAGSYALSGQAAGMYLGHTLVASAGSYALSGQAANLLAARKLAAAAGSYALSGAAAVLSHGFTLVAGAGAYSLSGQAAAFARTYVLTTAAGAYTLSGRAASLIYIASAGFSFVDPDAGTLILPASPDPSLEGVDPDAGTVVIQS